MEKDILEKLKAIVKPYIKNPADVETMTEDTDFIKDLQVNSANLVDIVLDIEEAFNITIDAPEMEQMLNVRATIDIIAGKL